MYIYNILYDLGISDIILYPMLSLRSDPILFFMGDPILFSLGDPTLFLGGEPPGARAWAFPDFMFGGNVMPYFGGGIHITGQRNSQFINYSTHRLIA